MYKSLGFLLSGVLLLLAGCFSGDDGVPPTPLTDTVWRLSLDSLQDCNISWQRPLQDITLKIDEEGRVFGCAGVNNYRGKAQIDPDMYTIRFSPMISTRRAGVGLEYESHYLGLLHQIDHYRIDGTELTLLQNDQAVAVFNAPTP